MSLLPGMTVTAPGDPNEVAELLPQVFRLPGPAYVRIGRFGEPSYEAAGPIVLGKARLIRDGVKVTLLSTGDMALAAADALKILAGEGIYPSAYQFHTVKPLDVDALESIAEKAAVMIVVEEHTPYGGLGMAVGMWAAERAGRVRVLRVGPPDALALGNLKQSDLRVRLKYDVESICAACRAAWGSI